MNDVDISTGKKCRLVNFFLVSIKRQRLRLARHDTVGHKRGVSRTHDGRSR